tara:strand:+ start:48651 stop:49529 length:879 start_codon:yes stop_codon:yes gene_type:complete
MKATISGSLQKYANRINNTILKFKSQGIEVLSPKSAEIVSEYTGFVTLKGDVIKYLDGLADATAAMRMIENSHLHAIQQSDFLYIESAEYIGPSTAFEIGWALAHNVPTFYAGQTTEPILRMYCNQVQNLTEICGLSIMPKVDPQVSRSIFYKISKQLNSSIAVGAMIVNKDKEILLVQTHKWGDKLSIVGGRIQPNQNLESAIVQAITQQTKLSGNLGQIICTFQEIPNSGYYQPHTQRTFIDKIFYTPDLKVMLDHRAQDYSWVKPEAALDLEIESNAKKSVQDYLSYCC